MGGASSHDEASDSLQAKDEHSNSRPQYSEETSAVAKECENKLKTVEKEPEAKPQVIVHERLADVKPIYDAKAKTVKEVKLPHNCESILRDADSPVDRSSVDKLYDQLSTGVFLNQKRKVKINSISLIILLFLTTKSLQFYCRSTGLKRSATAIASCCLQRIYQSHGEEIHVTGNGLPYVKQGNYKCIQSILGFLS